MQFIKNEMYIKWDIEKNAIKRKKWDMNIHKIEFISWTYIKYIKNKIYKIKYIKSRINKIRHKWRGTCKIKYKNEIHIK